MCRFAPNPYRDNNRVADTSVDPLFGDPDILLLHQSLPEYHPTPTHALPALARELGLRQIFVKDESHRFGLKAFKALGASYATYRVIEQQRQIRGQPSVEAASFYRSDERLPTGEFTFCTATDGNHGRGVAWVARKLRQRAVIYMPANSVAARIENIRSEGAEVTVVDGSYDDAVTRAAADAEANGWQIISDTSWNGYEEIPRWIMAAYTTMFHEIHALAETPVQPGVVIVQGGVGALAAAAAWYYRRAYAGPPVTLVSVEPISAACLLASISSPDGQLTRSAGVQDSIMAGLNCGTPSLVAWPLIRHGFDLFISVSDDYCREAMRTYASPCRGDPRIISGESGAAGLAALLALLRDSSLAPARSFLDLGEQSTVLLLNTEGDTDPDGYRRIVVDSARA
jgi:diaminopropionate ammonia-lyase